jgi:hypothetical protein
MFEHIWKLRAHGSYPLPLLQAWSYLSSVATEIAYRTLLQKMMMNQAALGDVFYLFLSGQPEVCIQTKTEKDRGVILNDPSTHKQSLQGRRYYITHKFHTHSWACIKGHKHLLTRLRL